MIDRTTADLLRELINRPAGLTPDLVPPTGLAPLVAAKLAAPMLCTDGHGVPVARLCVTLEGFRQLERRETRRLAALARCAPALTAIASILTAIASLLVAAESLRQARADKRECEKQPTAIHEQIGEHGIENRDGVEEAPKPCGKVGNAANGISDLSRQRETVPERKPLPEIVRPVKKNGESEKKLVK